MSLDSREPTSEIAQDVSCINGSRWRIALDMQGLRDFFGRGGKSQHAFYIDLASTKHWLMLGSYRPGQRVITLYPATLRVFRVYSATTEDAQHSVANLLAHELAHATTPRWALNVERAIIAGAMLLFIAVGQFVWYRSAEYYHFPFWYIVAFLLPLQLWSVLSLGWIWYRYCSFQEWRADACAKSWCADPAFLDCVRVSCLQQSAPTLLQNPPSN